MFALLDGNNFYCSCERVFQPRLARVPLVVLSNNDGCAIARSEEAKHLGIKMGAPYFQIKHLEHEAGLVALSANFTLYGDMSARMMAVAAHMGVGQEVYSIDEAFMDMSGLPADTLTQRAWHTHHQVARWVGIPNCVGIAPTKTLAKLANHIAKSADRKPGSYPARLAKVCNLAEFTSRQRQILYAATDVGEVWGIGRRIGKQLRANGIQTVWDFMQMDAGTIRRHWSVVLERTWQELHGQPCLQLEAPQPKQTIAHTRSFGRPVTAQEDLGSAITDFAARAAAKARKQGSQAGHVMIFIQTSPFRQNEAQYSRSTTIQLHPPTASTQAIVTAALEGLRRIYRNGYNYARAGVMLLDLQSAVDGQQTMLDFSGGNEQSAKQSKLMQALDSLTDRFGQGTVRLGSSMLGQRQWVMRQERKTPRYTTSLEEIPVART